MPRPIRIQYEHAYYHVINRGRARQTIFQGAGYYEDFLTTLEECHRRFRCANPCILFEEQSLPFASGETPRATLVRIMCHLNGVYTQRYNRRKRSDGPLFRGRYKAILAFNMPVKIIAILMKT